jgi:adenine-specific DNA-methyltransferase
LLYENEAFCSSHTVRGLRYIGNKTRLLDFIGRTLRARGITAGSAVDPFSGTASVAAALKRWGFRVHASDVMEYGHVFARAYVAHDGCTPLPGGDAVAERSPPAQPCAVRAALERLNAVPPRPGFMHDEYTPAGGAGAVHGRMYFTPENGARIDAMRDTLRAWQQGGAIDAATYFLLLAALIEGADRVANTTGVYAAYVKSWQPNALRPIRLEMPAVTPGAGSSAGRGDALEVVRARPDFDLLYLDPPYNNRQYTGYYHVPELIATGWYDGGIEPRGKTGLVTDPAKRSDWSRRGHCEGALETLIATARCRHIVLSYNSEGLIPERSIERILRTHGNPATYRRHQTSYRRYRADADGVGRRYRADRVREYLYCVSR